MADERPGGPPATPAIGAVPLPPGYVLVEKLGSGGFATVWLAEQGRLGRRVAVKLLGETLEDSERERRFIAECRAIGRLSGHPAVVTVHDAGTTDAGHPYLVMEHLPGGSLHDRLHRQGPLPWPEVLDVGVHVADALAAAHEAGILHRDVKPANVLLDENGSPKLGDFGIARLAEGTNTATGTLVGTIPFTPPEVLSGHRPGPTADVWALGATLHTLLAGTSPFGGHRDEPPAATIARVLRSEAPPLGPEVPAALRELIAASLRPEPRDRPETATEVVAELQAIQADRGLPVTPARATRRAAPSPPTGGTDATVVGLPPIPTTPPPSQLGGERDTSVSHSPPSSWGEPDPDAATVAGAAASAPPPPAPPPPAPTPPARAPEAMGATSVLPAYQAPAAASPGAPPPPPPGPSGRSGGSERSAKAPVLVGLAVVVALVLVAGVVLALTRGGDDDGGEAGAGDATETTAGGSTEAPPATAVDTPLGAPLVVPSGLARQPATPAAWDEGVACSEGASCSIVADDGGVVAVMAAGDGTATVEQRAGATGEVEWSLPIGGLSSPPGLARLGDLVIVSSTAGETRTYRGIDDTGTERWTLPVDQDDQPVFPNTQLSPDYGVLLLGGADAYLVVDLQTGVAERGEGRVLATDRANVYVADGDRVVARTLSSGDELWEADGVVSAAPVGDFPAWRYGVVASEVFVAATPTHVVAINRESGEEVWPSRCR
jgi:serine/threonine-protein kinase PknK